MTKSKISMIIFCILLIVIVYDVYPLIRARTIVAKTRQEFTPFTRSDSSAARHILIIGDSTAVGFGAAPTESVAGRLSEYLDASVENYAVIGAVTADLPQQIQKAERDTYDLVHIQIGANDVIGIGPLRLAAEALDKALVLAKAKSDHVTVLTAGDIGKAPIFRWPLSLAVSYRTRILREFFMEVCAKRGVRYVDVYAKPDIFSEDIQRYHAPDGLHLSSEGYEYWFRLITEEISVWPELIPVRS